MDPTRHCLHQWCGLLQCILLTCLPQWTVHYLITTTSAVHCTKGPAGRGEYSPPHNQNVNLGNGLWRPVTCPDGTEDPPAGHDSTIQLHQQTSLEGALLPRATLPQRPQHTQHGPKETQETPSGRDWLQTGANLDSLLIVLILRPLSQMNICTHHVGKGPQTQRFQQKNALTNKDYYTWHCYNKNDGERLWHHAYKVKACTVDTLWCFPTENKATGDAKQEGHRLQSSLCPWQTSKDQSGPFSRDIAAESLVLLKI